MYISFLECRRLLKSGLAPHILNTFITLELRGGEGGQQQNKFTLNLLRHPYVPLLNSGNRLFRSTQSRLRLLWSELPSQPQFVFLEMTEGSVLLFACSQDSSDARRFWPQVETACPTIIGAILARTLFLLLLQSIADGAHKNGVFFEGRGVGAEIDRRAPLFRSHCSLCYSLGLCQKSGGRYSLLPSIVRRHFA